MRDEASIVRKTESAIDDLADLWRRRKLVCLVVLVVIVVPVGFGLYQEFIAIPRLQNDVEAKKAEIEDLKGERDKFEIELSSFQAAADKAFPDQKKEERMDLLLTAFQQAGRKTEIHTNLGVTGITSDGKPWSGVILSMNNLKSPPFVAQAILQILSEQGLKVHTHEGSGYGSNA